MPRTTSAAPAVSGDNTVEVAAAPAVSGDNTDGRRADGRRARRDRNRERVVDAMLELYREGDLRPSVHTVAERSGVSHRSVFRYFDDLGELCRVAIDRQFVALFDLWVVPDTGIGPLDERVDRLVEQRLALYDAAASVWRVGQTRAPFEPVLERNLQRTAADKVEQMRRHFAAELDGLNPDRAALLAEALAAMCSLDAIELLRHVRALDRPTTAAILSSMLSAVLTAELHCFVGHVSAVGLGLGTLGIQRRAEVASGIQ